MKKQPLDQPIPCDDRFDAVANASVDGLLVIDSDGVVQFANPVAIAMFAEKVENLVGFHFGTPAFRQPTELQLPAKGGIRYVEIRASEFSWNGREATLANLRDITKRKQAEEALRESEALLSRTQEIAHTGSWKLDLTANRLTWSDEVYRIFGCKPQVFAPTYEAFLDFVHPEDRAVVDAAYSRSLREGNDGYEIEHRIVRRNSDEVRYVHERCVHERDAAGAIIQSTGMVQDITERKKADEQIRFQADIIENSPAIAAYHDTELNVVWVNKAYQLATGLSLEEVRGRKCYQVWNLSGPCRGCPVITAIETGENAAHELTPDNQDHWPEMQGCWLCQASPVRDEQGAVIGALEFAIDITERKRSEDALRTAERNLRSTVDGLSAHIAVLDEHGEIILTNKSYSDFAEQNGIEPDTVSEGTNYLAVCDTASGEHSEEAKPFSKGIREVLSGKRQSFELEYPCNSPDEKRWFVGRVTLFAGEAPRRVIVAHEDITERKRAEEALRASEGKLRSVFASMTEIVVLHELVCDEDGRPVNYRILDCNPAFTQITGIRRDDAVGRLATDVYGSDTAPYLDEYARVAMTGEPCTFITSYAPMDKHFDIHLASPGKNKFITVTTDITESKQVENYREMRRDILQILNEPGDLQESIQSILTALKTRTGADAVGLRLQAGEDFPYFAQDGFSQDFLLTENTLVERGKDGGVCRDKDGNVSLECTCGLVISGQTDPANPLFTKGGSCWTNDSFPLLDLPPDRDPRLHPRNNCIHQGYASVALIPVWTKDRIVGLIQLNDKRKGRFTFETIEILEGIAAHIGSALMRKRAESELGRLSTAIEHSPETVVITDTEGTIQYVNPAFETITGYTGEEAIGQNPRILKSGQQDAEFYTAMWNTLLDGRVWVGRMVNKRKDGSLYTEEASIAPVKEPTGTITNYVGVKRDITAELEREELLRQAHKMESVGRLAGGVAHDFNNLLMGIMGYAELCQNEIGPDHPAQELLTCITREAERSANLTRQLLAFARKQPVAPQVLDLNDAVANMLKMLRRLITEDISLSWKPGTELSSVKIDPGQVDQILANLCVNARDAIRGTGMITIKTQNVTIDAEFCSRHAEAASGSYVMLAISDDGCGMDQETLAQVFEPFFTTKGVGKGTGLGLATVYGVVKQNGGFVDVHSEPGQGSTFTIYIPRHLAKANPEPGKEPQRPCVRGHETILLVEDEASILKTTAKRLQLEGYTVLAAGTPDDAIRLATEHQGEVHFILSDVVLPEMNGRDLANQILTIYPKAKILFMSGYTANVIAHNGVLDEGVNFIPKPFLMSDLLPKLREILDQGR